MTARRLGLTGGIGSGKSTVAAMLVQLGGTLVDTDAIARSLTAPGGGGLQALARRFGPDILGPDGALDRAAMRTRVFQDPATRAELESVLHPLIATEAERQAQGAASGWVVFDVPLLAESVGWRARVDRVIVVDCPVETQLQRVMARSDWSEQAARGAIAAQASRARRRRIADAVIDNGPRTSLAALLARCEALAAAWRLDPAQPTPTR